MKKEMIAMLLAGGQGSRLGKLTKETILLKLVNAPSSAILSMFLI